jgi:tripartite-type tricarboxylate transporter receptor subunit TctC
MLDLLAGRIDFTVLNPSSILPNVETGELRLLAVTSKTRFDALPDAPTMTELGYPEVDLDGWFGIAGPANLPPAIVNALYTKFAGVLNAPDLNGRLTEQGWVVDPISPERFRDLIKNDIVRTSRLLKDAGAH